MGNIQNRSFLKTALKRRYINDVYNSVWKALYHLLEGRARKEIV